MRRGSAPNAPQEQPINKFHLLSLWISCGTLWSLDIGDYYSLTQGKERDICHYLGGVQEKQSVKYQGLETDLCSGLTLSGFGKIYIFLLSENGEIMRSIIEPEDGQEDAKLKIREQEKICKKFRSLLVRAFGEPKKRFHRQDLQPKISEIWRDGRIKLSIFVEEMGFGQCAFSIEHRRH